MFRFIRTATLSSGADAPRAMQHGLEITGFISSRYGIDLKFGLEMFNSARLHWHFDTDSLADIEELNAKLMQDQDYWALVETGRSLWVDGSIADRVVNVLA